MVVKLITRVTSNGVTTPDEITRVTAKRERFVTVPARAIGRMLTSPLWGEWSRPPCFPRVPLRSTLGYFRASLREEMRAHLRSVRAVTMAGLDSKLNLRYT